MWGLGVPADKRAHADEKMTCQTCHTSWTTSCAGCHLPIEANEKTDRHHYEGGASRNYATYNPQVVRDDMFFIGRHGPVKGSKITPIRSSSALVLSSTNANRERIYIQQPPTAASRSIPAKNHSLFMRTPNGAADYRGRRRAVEEESDGRNGHVMPVTGNTRIQH